MGAAIRIRDLTLGYDRHPVVHHLSGAFGAGSLTAVCGPNGAGKSTLMKAITGGLKPIGGELRLDDCPKGAIAYLPQAVDIDRGFPIGVFDFVAMGLWNRAGAFGGLSRADHDRVETAIAAVGLVGFERRAIGKLSGGQMQRVLFARVLLQDAPLILLDEPFTAIDSKTVEDLVALIHRWHGEARTVVAVLHDVDLVRRTFPDTLLIAREPIAWGATREVLTAENLLKARAMIEAPDPEAVFCERAA
jgi:zinc/manganese transport system ATP-binding protein